MKLENIVAILLSLIGPACGQFDQWSAAKASNIADNPNEPVEIRFEPPTTAATVTAIALKAPVTHKFASLTFGNPTASSASRMRLLAHLTNAMHKQQNLDQLPTHVMVKLIPIKIQDLNEKNEVLETTVRLQLTWQDSRLSWNPKSYYNVSEMVIPGNSLWSPDVGILNSVSDIYHVVRDTRFEMKVESTGRVWWHPTGIVKTYCKLHLRYFPFDRQKCSMVLESPTLDLRFMNLTLRSTTEPVDTRMFLGGETWDLLSVSGDNIFNKLGSRTTFTRVEFNIHIQRARIYHMLNVILPAIFLSLVQLLFFLLPPTHPQRVGSSTTTLLSVVVFHSVAVSQLPKTSTDVPLLAIYIFIVTFVSGISVSTSIFVAKFVVYAQEKHRIPSCLRRIPNPMFRARRFRNSLFNSQETQKAESQSSLSSPTVHVLRNVPMMDEDDQILNQRVKNNEDEVIEMMPKEQVHLAKPSPEDPRMYLFNTWQDVSIVLDWILMLTAVTMALLSPLILFVVIPHLVE